MFLGGFQLPWSPVTKTNEHLGREHRRKLETNERRQHRGTYIWCLGPQCVLIGMVRRKREHLALRS